MKAAVLNELNAPLIIKELPDPELLPGSIIVRVQSSYVMSYTKNVLDGKSGFTLPVPYTPGLCAVGIIEAVDAGVNGLRVGQRVFCQPNFSSHTNRTPNDSILIGWFGLYPESEHLISRWKNGAFAEKTVYPAECVTPIRDHEFTNADQLCVLNILNIGYGALLTGGFKASQTVIINGATGNIGAGLVVLSLALGASKVIAVGRDHQKLSELKELDKRVSSFELGEDCEENAKGITALSDERNLFIDASASSTADPTRACIHALSRGGVAVLVGGVRADIPIPFTLMHNRLLTIKGSYMYPDSATGDLLKLIGSGQLDLGVFKIHTYPLEKINEAIQSAPFFKGLECCVINPTHF